MIHATVQERLPLVIDPQRQLLGGAQLSWKNGSSLRSRRNMRRSHDALKRWWTTRVHIPLTGGAGKPRSQQAMGNIFRCSRTDQGCGTARIASPFC